jgi:hypothetical protein
MLSFYLTLNKLIYFKDLRPFLYCMTLCPINIKRRLAACLSISLLHDTLSNRHQKTVSSLSLYFFILSYLSPKTIKTNYSFSKPWTKYLWAEIRVEIVFVNIRNVPPPKKNKPRRPLLTREENVEILDLWLVLVSKYLTLDQYCDTNGDIFDLWLAL